MLLDVLETGTANALVFIFSESSAAAGKGVLFYGEGGPGVGSKIIGHGDTRRQRGSGRGVQGGAKEAGLARVRGRVGGRTGNGGRAIGPTGGGFGIGGGYGIAWLLRRGLVLLFAEPLRLVDLCLDGRGRGLRPGWGEAAVRNEAFDGYDHGKGLDLAGDAASGHFGAEIGQFPEPGQDLVATKVQLAQPSAS